MVTILPREPSLMEMLGGGLSQGFQAGMQQRRELEERSKQGQALAQVLGLTPEQGNAFGSLSPKMQEQYFKMSVEPQIKMQEAAAKEQLKLQGSQLKKEQEEKAAKEQLLPAFARLRELVPYGGRWGLKPIIGKIPYTEAASKREELDQLGLWLADSVYTRFNKGMLAKVKWEDIKKRLSPQASLSDAENNARINAMEKIMNLPPNVKAEDMQKMIDQQGKKIDIASRAADKEKPQQLTEQKALEILRSVNNDKESARKIAKEMGYEF